MTETKPISPEELAILNFIPELIIEILTIEEGPNPLEWLPVYEKLKYFIKAQSEAAVAEMKAETEALEKEVELWQDLVVEDRGYHQLKDEYKQLQLKNEALDAENEGLNSKLGLLKAQAGAMRQALEECSEILQHYISSDGLRFYTDLTSTAQKALATDAGKEILEELERLRKAAKGFSEAYVRVGHTAPIDEINLEFNKACNTLYEAVEALEVSQARGKYADLPSGSEDFILEKQQEAMEES